MTTMVSTDRFDLLVLQRSASNGDCAAFLEALNKGANPFKRAPIHSRGTCALLHAVSASASPGSVFPVLVERFGSESLLASAYLEHVAHNVAPQFIAEELTPVLSSAIVFSPNFANSLLNSKRARQIFSSPPAVFQLWSATLHSMFSVGRSPPATQQRVIESLLGLGHSSQMLGLGGPSAGALRLGLSMLTFPALKACLNRWRQELQVQPSTPAMAEVSHVVLKGAEQMSRETRDIYFLDIRKDWPHLSPLLIECASALGEEASVQGNWPVFLLALQAQDVFSFGSAATPFQPTQRQYLSAARHEANSAPLSMMAEKFGPALEFGNLDLRLVASTWSDPGAFVSWVSRNPQVRVGDPASFMEGLSKESLKNIDEARVAALQQRYLEGTILVDAAPPRTRM